MAKIVTIYDKDVTPKETRKIQFMPSTASLQSFTDMVRQKLAIPSKKCIVSMHYQQDAVCPLKDDEDIKLIPNNAEIAVAIAVKSDVAKKDKKESETQSMLFFDEQSQ